MTSLSLNLLFLAAFEKTTHKDPAPRFGVGSLCVVFMCCLYSLSVLTGTASEALREYPLWDFIVNQLCDKGEPNNP